MTAKVRITQIVPTVRHQVAPTPGTPFCRHRPPAYQSARHRCNQKGDPHPMNLLELFRRQPDADPLLLAQFQGRLVHTSPGNTIIILSDGTTAMKLPTWLNEDQAEVAITVTLAHPPAEITP